MIIFDAKIFENDSLLSLILSRGYQIYIRFIITANTIHFEFRTGRIIPGWTKLNYTPGSFKSNTNIHSLFTKYPWLKDLSGGKFETTYDEITNLWRVEL